MQLGLSSAPLPLNMGALTGAMICFCMVPVLMLGCITGVWGQELADLASPLFPLRENAGSSSLFPMFPCGSFHLEEATIDDMQRAMQDGTLTSVQLVKCYMLRIQQVDDYIK